MGSKKTSTQIKEKILDELKTGPKTITEISGLISSNWLTTEKFLKELNKDSFVIEVFSSPKMKVYIRADDPTYYNLPFSKDIRDKTIFILSKIVELWKVKKGTYPNKTTTQKIAVEVIRECDLALPVLEFHYGKVTCMNVPYEKNLVEIYNVLPPKSFQEKILGCINKRINSGGHTGKSFQERILQYGNEKMHFYNAKEDLIKAFNNSNKKEDIPKNLIELLVNFPMKLEKYYVEFNDFISTSLALLSVDLESDNLSKIKETFFSLWDLLTTASYFEDAGKFILPERRELFELIKSLNLNSKKMGYETLSTELQSELISIDENKLKMPQDLESKEIQGLFLESLE